MPLALPQPHQHELVLPWNPKKNQPAHWDRLHTKHNSRRGRGRQHQQQDYVACIKYGVGIAAGISVVGWLKRKIKQLPVVGLLASPFLSLMPTVLLGSAVGAAVVYGIDEGDPMAVQKKVLPKVKQQLEVTHREVASAAADLQRGVQRSMRDMQGQSSEALRGLSRTLDAAAAEAEVTLAPIARAQALEAQKQLRQLEHTWKDVAAEFERGGSSSNSHSKQQQSVARRGGARRHSVAAGSSSDNWD